VLASVFIKKIKYYYQFRSENLSHVINKTCWNGMLEEMRIWCHGVSTAYLNRYVVLWFHVGAVQQLLLNLIDCYANKLSTPVGIELNQADTFFQSHSFKRARTNIKGLRSESKVLRNGAPLLRGEDKVVRDQLKEALDQLLVSWHTFCCPWVYKAAVR
jgi:hypothetical protein